MSALGVTATLLFYSSVSTLVSCGSDSSTSFAGPSGNDSGTGGGEDGSTTSDAGAGGEGGASPSLTLLVHASADADDFRICFGTTDNADGGAAVPVLPLAPLPDDATHPMPRTNYPGVPAGGGVVLKAAFGGAKTYLVPYLVNAETLATKSTLAGKTCDQIFCGSGASCLKSTDYDTLPPIATTSVAGGGTRVLVVTGCRAGTSVPARCGPGYDPATGNLALRMLPLDAVPTSGATKIGVQIAQVAPVLGSVAVSYGALDGGTSLGTVAYGTVAPPTALPSDRPTSDPAFESTGLRVTELSDGGASGAPYTMSLAAVATASDPTQVPGDYFAGGKNYVFVLIGDPAYPADDAGTQLVRGFHAIALATTPTKASGSL